jgi:hypothetical protein
VSLARLWAFLAVGLPVLGALLANLQSVDLAYHLRAGGLIIDTAVVPSVDSFTFTAAGLPWQDQQWAAEVILAGAFRTAGWTGLVVLRALLVGVTFGLVFDICRRGNSNRAAALLTLAAFGLAAVTLALRPQLFGMSLFAVVLWLVSRRHERPGVLWFVVPMTAAWANLHGSFFFAPLLLVLAAVEDTLNPATRKRAGTILAVGMVAIAATLLNPFGPAVWQYAIGVATNPVVTNRITEWQPTTPLSPEGAAFYASLGLDVALVALRARRLRRLDVRPVVWLAPFAVVAIRAVRGLAWWPLVAAPTVALLVRRPDDSQPPRDRSDPPLIRRLNVVVAAFLVAAGVALLPAWRPLERGLDAPLGVVGAAPPGITAALRDVVGSADRLFAPQPWGSWFEFALPGTPVFVDSRIELFPAAVWDDYDAILEGGDRAIEAIDRWDVTVVVAVDRLGNEPLSKRLLAVGWRQVYMDEDGAIYERAPAAGSATRRTPRRTGPSGRGAALHRTVPFGHASRA